MQSALFSSEAMEESTTLSLARLREQAEGCKACGLCETRQKVVFGTGNPNSPKVAFIGEGPGATEDAQGLPFVGPSGQLLTRMIQRMELDREKDCYVLNAVACRPPGNRVPEAKELVACLPIFHEQLKLIRPQVIITLGKTATVALLSKDKDMHELRGKWHKWEGIPVRPTFHPSYLLRVPKERQTALVDLNAVALFLRTGATSASARKD